MSTPLSQPSAGDGSKDNAPKSWNCGDSYQYPLPGPDGDPWNSLLKPLLENDSVKCDTWKDEVQNLLIFAGLFSAVVTAFAVETYKDLQEDPVVALLAQIAANSAKNGLTETPLPFTPSAATIHLNIFLFLSLILSLSSVLIGIVALQWIREHRQLSNALSPQNMFATLHMRTEALHRWHVPQVFAALPLLLQLALVFFFAGIFQLLTDASTVVLIPVACVMGITMLFLILTTILPTVQAISLNHSTLRINDEIPVLCPYKSPQAQAFRRFLTSSKTLFGVASLFFGAIYWVTCHVFLLPGQVGLLPYCAKTIQLFHSSYKRASDYVSRFFSAFSHWMSRTLFDADCLTERHEFDYMRPHIFYYWCLPSWLEFDLGWMSVRDAYFHSTRPRDTWLFLNRESGHTSGTGLYEVVQGLRDELTKKSYNLRIDPGPGIITAYHCAMSACFPSGEKLDPNDSDIVESVFSRNHYLATLLGNKDVTPLEPFSEILRSSDFQVLWEETSFIFLSFIQEQFDNTGLRPSNLTEHFAEVYLRLLSHLYSEPYEMDREPQSGYFPDVALEANELYVLDIYHAPNQAFTHQWALSINLFFRVLGDHGILYSKIHGSFHAHPFFCRYSANFLRQLKYELHTGIVHEDTVCQVVNTLLLINDILRRCLVNQEPGEVEEGIHLRSQFVFHTVAVHLYPFKLWNINRHDLTPAVKETIELLQDVKDRFHSLGIKVNLGPEPDVISESDDAVDRISWFTGAWWKELFPDFLEGDQDGSQVSRHTGTNSSRASVVEGEHRIDILSPQISDR